jgi:hypothetical protein
VFEIQHIHDLPHEDIYFYIIHYSFLSQSLDEDIVENVSADTRYRLSENDSLVSILRYLQVKKVNE